MSKRSETIALRLAVFSLEKLSRKQTTVQIMVTTSTRTMTARQVMTVRSLLRRRFLRMRRENFMRSAPLDRARRREVGRKASTGSAPAKQPKGRGERDKAPYSQYDD